jgi:hypothetical protein
MASHEHDNEPSGSTKRELLNQLRYYQLRDNDLMYVRITNLCPHLTVYDPCIILTNNYKTNKRTYNY